MPSIIETRYPILKQAVVQGNEELFREQIKQHYQIGSRSLLSFAEIICRCILTYRQPTLFALFINYLETEFEKPFPAIFILHVRKKFHDNKETKLSQQFIGYLAQCLNEQEKSSIAYLLENDRAILKYQRKEFLSEIACAKEQHSHQVSDAVQQTLYNQYKIGVPDDISKILLTFMFFQCPKLDQYKNNKPTKSAKNKLLTCLFL